MILTDQQKDDLKSLKEHRGYKVQLFILEEKKKELFSDFETKILTDPDVLQKLNQSQNFNQGMKYIIESVDNLTKKISKKEHK